MHVKILPKSRFDWKSVARKFDFVCLCFDNVGWITLNQFSSLTTIDTLKQLSSRFSKNKNWKKKLKLTLNSGQVMFSGEIYYYWPLNLVDKSLVNIFFPCIIYCISNAVAVTCMYSRNIPMAEKRIVCFQSKQVKICSFFSNNYYVYLKSYLEKNVTNNLFSIFWRTAPLSCLGGRKVTHQTAVPEVPWSNPRSDTHFLMLFYWVYLTYCKLCVQFKGH